MWLETSSGAAWEKKSFSSRAERIGLWWGPRQFKQGNQSLGNTATDLQTSNSNLCDLKLGGLNLAYLAGRGVDFWALAFLGTWRTSHPAIPKPIIYLLSLVWCFLENSLIFSKTQSWRGKDLSRGRASWRRSENEGGWFTHSVNAAIKRSNAIIHILRFMDQKAGRSSSTFLIQNISLDPVLLASYIIMYFRTVTGQLFYHKLLGLTKTLSEAQ